MTISFESPRLIIAEFDMKDAEDLFSCISPAVATFMPWEPPQSVDELRAHWQQIAKSIGAGDFSLSSEANRRLNAQEQHP